MYNYYFEIFYTSSLGLSPILRLFKIIIEYVILCQYHTLKTPVKKMNHYSFHLWVYSCISNGLEFILIHKPKGLDLAHESSSPSANIEGQIMGRVKVTTLQPVSRQYCVVVKDFQMMYNNIEGYIASSSFFSLR